jgi:Nucleoside-diphosphate-sugar epimerases
MPLKEADFFEGLPHYGEFGYAMAKRHAYTYLKIISQETEMLFSYGIFTNLYGENDRFDESNGHIIPSLISKAYSASLSGKNLNVWGNGSAERDFLYAEDAARAVLLCLEDDNPQRIINISSGRGIRIGYIAETIAKNCQPSEHQF